MSTKRERIYEPETVRGNGARSLLVREESGIDPSDATSDCKSDGERFSERRITVKVLATESTKPKRPSKPFSASYVTAPTPATSSAPTHTGLARQSPVKIAPVAVPPRQPDERLRLASALESARNDVLQGRRARPLDPMALENQHVQQVVRATLRRVSRQTRGCSSRSRSARTRGMS